MSKIMRFLGLAALPGLLMLCSAGCGGSGPPAREDILKTPAEELHGASVKAQLYEFRAKVRKRGVDAAKAEISILLENFEGFEEQPVGEHLETYKQIVEKIKALDESLKGSPNADEVKKAAEEIGELAAKLPGKAEENPEVE